jgi:Cytochrome c, mono- and diheme variants
MANMQRRPQSFRLVSWSSLAFCSVVIFAASQCVVASSSADAPAAPNAKAGGEIFQKRCIICHNKQKDDDSPFGPPNLYAKFHGNPPLTAQQAETTITHGKGQMPAFGGILSRSEIRSVIAYLRTR